jgi:hypothetical protein
MHPAMFDFSSGVYVGAWVNGVSKASQPRLKKVVAVSHKQFQLVFFWILNILLLISRVTQNQPKIAGWLFQTLIFVFHVIYGMSSFPLMNSMIFQDGYCTTNQIYYMYRCSNLMVIYL